MTPHDTHNTDRPSTLVSFFRYNASAIIATTGDFLTLVFLTEVLYLWYLFSTVIGALVGACIAFALGRNWAFVSKEERKRVQAVRYTIVALGSLALNTLGVYFFTEVTGFPYTISKVITAVIVGVGYNYTLSKYYIFK